MKKYLFIFLFLLNSIDVKASASFPLEGQETSIFLDCIENKKDKFVYEDLIRYCPCYTENLIKSYTYHIEDWFNKINESKDEAELKRFKEWNAENLNKIYNKCFYDTNNLTKTERK